MAVLFADGFEDGLTAWSSMSNAGAGTGRFGNGLAMTLNIGRAEVGFIGTAGPIIAGFAFKPAGPGAIASFCGTTNANNTHVGLTRGASGEITVFRNSTASVLGTTAINVLPTGAWSYIELKITVSDTTGTVVLRVNGVQVLNLSGQDTKDSTLTTAVCFVVGSSQSAPGGATGNVFDDFYLCDTTGTVNNDFLGDLTVEHLRPIADDTAQWLGSDGNSTNNFQLVDEAGTYDGADYVASSTVGQRDLYTPTASARPTSSPVVGVVVVAVAGKSDAGTRTVKIDVKEGSGGTVRPSADLGLPTSFGELFAVFERKGDGSQFTVADVNALRMGIEVST